MNYLSKNIIIVVLVLGSIIFSTYIVFAGKSVPIAPIQGKTIPVVFNGSEKNYYLLSKQSPIKLKVDGPTKIEVLTRLSVPKHHSAAEKYSIKVIEGKEVVKVYSTSTEKSDASYKNSDLVPGKSRKFTIDLPKGSHTLEFQLENTNLTEAALKFYVASGQTGSGKRGINLEPLSYDRVVTATVNEKLITYFVSSKERNVQLRVVGPTRLQVLARLNFDATMKGEQSFALSIWEGEKKVLLKALSTSKSLGITYQEWKDVVPGKVETIYFDVPKGEHTYKFILEETVAHSVALKFSIPKKDLSNEG